MWRFISIFRNDEWQKCRSDRSWTLCRLVLESTLAGPWSLGRKLSMVHLLFCDKQSNYPQNNAHLHFTLLHLTYINMFHHSQP